MGHGDVAHTEPIAEGSQSFSGVPARLQKRRELEVSQHNELDPSSTHRKTIAKVSPLIVRPFSIPAKVLGGIPMRSAASRMLM